MQVVKVALQKYNPSPEVLVLLNDFRKMMNDCVRIGLAENITSMTALSKKVYHQFERYKVPTYYRLTAISRATGFLKNYREAQRKNPNVKNPFVSKLMLTDCYGFKIADGRLRLSMGNKQYEYIPLNNYVLRSIAGYTVRSVTLTTCTIAIAFSKETVVIDPKGLIGIDRNLDNVSIADSNGIIQVFDLSKATIAKENCRQAKRGFHRNDHRITKQIYSKYGNIQKNKVGWVLNNASAKIIQQAKEKQFGIVMEDLKGIRKLYRKGNGQGKDYRAKLNNWSFYELQRQIEYKAKWLGIPVIYVPAAKTSSTCAICGSDISECTERKVWCGKCQRLSDRDENAALNIVKAGVRFAPKGKVSEVMKGNDERFKRSTLILKADTSQLTTS